MGLLGVLPCDSDGCRQGPCPLLPFGEHTSPLATTRAGRPPEDRKGKAEMSRFSGEDELKN